MSRPGHPDPWTPPWRAGLPQAMCVGMGCTPVEGVGLNVVACTMTNGLCVVCASVVGDDERMTLGFS
jgi:hypothetical protein